MCRLKFVMFILILVPNIALSEVKQQNSVGTSPLPWLYGIINGSYERRIKPEIGVGVNGFTWNYISSDWKFSILGIGPNGRYYLEKENDGPSTLNYCYSSTNLALLFRDCQELF